MKMTNDPSSIGWQLVNALYGMRAQEVDEFIADSLDNQYIGSANPNETDYIYTTRHDISERQLTTNLGISAWDMNYTGISGVLSVTPVDTVEEFFNNIATRVIYDGDYVMPEGLDGNITGICYCVDYAPSGVVDVDEVYLINEQVDADVSGAAPFKVYDASDLSLVDAQNHGRVTQSYSTVGYDEQVRFASGICTAQLAHLPIDSSFYLYDYENVDPSGSPTLINPGEYILSNRTITDASGNLTSNYIAEYDYLAFSQGTYITTTDNFWDTNRWKGTRPLYSVVPASGEYQGTSIPFTTAKSPSTHGINLRCHPLDVRPGTNVDVTYTYTSFASGCWEDTSVQFSQVLDVRHFDSDRGFDNRTVRFYYGASELTTDLGLSPTWNTATSTLTVAPLTSGLHAEYPNLDIYFFYPAKRTGTYPAVASYSGDRNDTHPYPYDYFIEKKFSDETGTFQEHVLPASIIHVHASGLLDDGESISETVYNPLGYMPVLDLSNATEDQFSISQALEFGGICYDKDKDVVWAIEKTNQRLYRYNATNGALVNRYNILKPNRQNTADILSWVDPSGIEGGTLGSMPFIPQEYDEINSPRGMIYLDGYLWILNYPYEYNNIYFVEPERGSDDYTGTSSVYPFKTLYKASITVTAGDWIILLPGEHDVYNSEVGIASNFAASGTATSPIQILFASGATLACSSNFPAVHRLYISGDYYIIKDLVASKIGGSRLIVEIHGNHNTLIDFKMSDESRVDSLLVSGDYNEISFLRKCHDHSSMGEAGVFANLTEVTGNYNNIHHCLFVGDFSSGPTLLYVSGDHNIIDHCTFCTRKSYTHTGTYDFDQNRDCFQSEPGIRQGCYITGNSNIFSNNIVENQMNGLIIFTGAGGDINDNRVYHNKFHCNLNLTGASFTSRGIVLTGGISDYGRDVVYRTYDGLWYNNSTDSAASDWGVYAPTGGWTRHTTSNDPYWTHDTLHPIAGYIKYQPTKSSFLTWDEDSAQVGYSYPGRPMGISFIRIDTYDEHRMDIKWTSTGSTIPEVLPMPWDIILENIVSDICVGPNREILVAGVDRIYKIIPKYDYYIIDPAQGTIYYREPYTYLDIDGIDPPKSIPNLVE